MQYAQELINSHPYSYKSFALRCASSPAQTLWEKFRVKPWDIHLGPFGSLPYGSIMHESSWECL